MKIISFIAIISGTTYPSGSLVIVTGLLCDADESERAAACEPNSHSTTDVKVPHWVHAITLLHSTEILTCCRFDPKTENDTRAHLISLGSLSTIISVSQPYLWLSAIHTSLLSNALRCSLACPPWPEHINMLFVSHKGRIFLAALVADASACPNQINMVHQIWRSLRYRVSGNIQTLGYGEKKDEIF